MEPNNPNFSIVVTLTRSPNRVVDILASLQAQTYRDFEVVLVNVRDSFVELLFGEIYFPLIYIKMPHRSGLSDARNAGLKISRGRYICFLRDDGVFFPNHLQVLAEGLKKQPEAVVYTDAAYIGKHLQAGGLIEFTRSRAVEDGLLEYNNILVRNYISSSAWAFPRAAIARVGWFDSKLRALEDWDMLLRLARIYPVIAENIVTVEISEEIEFGQDIYSLWKLRQRKLAPVYKQIYALYPVSKDSHVQEMRNKFLTEVIGVEGL